MVFLPLHASAFLFEQYRFLSRIPLPQLTEQLVSKDHSLQIAGISFGAHGSPGFLKILIKNFLF